MVVVDGVVWVVVCVLVGFVLVAGGRVGVLVAIGVGVGGVGGGIVVVVVDGRCGWPWCCCGHCYCCC